MDLPASDTVKTLSGTFIKVAALSAFCTVVTTFLLWLMPKLYVAPGSFDESVLLYKNPFYMARLWINFFHLPLALTGYFGLMMLLTRQGITLAAFAMIWFLLWGVIEMTGIAVNLFSVNMEWRAGYENANVATKEILKTRIEMFASLWHAAFFVLLIAFLLGSLFLGWASWDSTGSQKMLSCLLWLAVPLTLLIILANYAHQQWAGNITTYVYPVLQPLSRFMLGYVLWNNIKAARN